MIASTRKRCISLVMASAITFTVGSPAIASAEQATHSVSNDATVNTIDDSELSQYEKEPSSAQSQEQLTKDLSDGFETLFTEVVKEVSPGVWEVDYEAAHRHGISDNEAKELAHIMETETAPTDPSSRYTTRDAGSYGRCVVYDALGFPLSPGACALGEQMP